MSRYEIAGPLSHALVGDAPPTNDPMLRRREIRPLQVGPRLTSSDGPAGNTALGFLHLENRFSALLKGLMLSGSRLALSSEQRLVNAMAKASELFYIGFARGRTRWAPPATRYERTKDLEGLALEAAIALWLDRPEAQEKVSVFQTAVGLWEEGSDARPSYGPVTRQFLGYFGRLWQEETPPETTFGQVQY